MPIPRVTLLDGETIPAMGFGTGTAWKDATGQNGISRVLVESLCTAVRTGFDHIDSAAFYKNEESTGTALKECGIDREQLFITTKIYEGIKDIQSTLKSQLKSLNLNYVNLYLIHSPTFTEKKGFPSLSQAWSGMETLQAQGLTKSIGVSNFRIKDLEILLDTAKVKPVLNQIELHPYVWAEAEPLIKFHKKYGIKTEAYGPLTPMIRHAGGPLDSIVSEIATRYGLTPGQVLIKWAYSKADIVLTTSSKEWRMKEQLSIFEKEGVVDPLTDDDIDKMDVAGQQGGIKRFFMTHMSN